MIVFRWTIAAKWMVGPSMDNCSEVWEKRILGWGQRQLRSRHCQADESARQGKRQRPGRLSARGRVLPAGVLFSRDDLDGSELRSSYVGPPGFAAVGLGRANEQAEAGWIDRGWRRRNIASGSSGPKC